MARFLFTIAAAISAVSAVPVSDIAVAPRQDSAPATVNIAPYAYVGCRMSQNPYDTTKPNDYNITTGSNCVNVPYTFQAYVEEANALAATGPCSLSLFPGPDCTGQASPATLTQYYDCIPDGGSWQSMELACGP